MSSPNVRYKPRPEATPEVAVDALSNVYRFILNCRAKKKAARPGGPDDAERRSSDIGATKNYSG